MIVSVEFFNVCVEIYQVFSTRVEKVSEGKMLPDGKKRQIFCLKCLLGAFIPSFFYAYAEQIFGTAMYFFYAYVDGSHFSMDTLKLTVLSSLYRKVDGVM